MKTQKTKILTALLLTGSLLPTITSAALLVEEYFDYAALNNTNLGSVGAWGGGTNNVRFQTASGPVFTGTGYVPDHAGGRVESNNSNTTDVRASHLSLGATPLSGEFWVSVFVNPASMTNINGSTTLMSFSSGNTSNAAYGGPGFGIYNNTNTSLNYALFNGPGGAAGVAATGTAATAADWQLLIARITINTDANDSIALWAFADDASVPTTVAGLGSAVVTSSSLDWGNSINNLKIGGQSFTTTGGKTAQWDDIRLSDLSSDAGLQEVLAIPEPGTLALLGIALGTLLLFRRRK